MKMFHTFLKLLKKILVKKEGKEEELQDQDPIQAVVAIHQELSNIKKVEQAISIREEEQLGLCNMEVVMAIHMRMMFTASIKAIKNQV